MGGASGNHALADQRKDTAYTTNVKKTWPSKLLWAVGYTNAMTTIKPHVETSDIKLTCLLQTQVWVREKGYTLNSFMN